MFQSCVVWSSEGSSDLLVMLVVRVCLTSASVAVCATATEPHLKLAGRKAPPVGKSRDHPCKANHVFVASLIDLGRVSILDPHVVSGVRQLLGCFPVGSLRVHASISDVAR